MIGLCGAQRVGKSTLAQAFAQEVDIPFVATSASDVFVKLGLDPKESYPIEVRLMIQRHILETFEKQYAHAQKHSNLFVSDRTPIDLASYLLADVERTTLQGQQALAKEVNQYVDDCLKMTSRFFSVIVLVQPGIQTVEAQGKAPTCPAHMEHLNAIQLGLLSDERNLVRRYSIPRRITSLEDRLKAMTHAVKSAVDANEVVTRHKVFH